MEPMRLTAKLNRPEEAVHQQGQLQTGNILGLPNELLLQVISYLSPGSIRNLMVNRSLRSVCEQGSYQTISLRYHPRRSIRLLETFLLRPDLASLVRHLAIDFSWIHPRRFPQTQVPPVIQPDGLAALSLAKNVQSFCLGGLASWIWDPELAKFREAISEMKLARLEVPVIIDPQAEYEWVLPANPDDEEVWPGDEETWDGDLGNEIRKLLQAQPMLEEFKLLDYGISNTTEGSLQASLLASDVPNLKSLQAGPGLAMAFLRVAPRLESLNLVLRNWNSYLLSAMETSSAAVKLSICRFTIRVRYSDNWFWDNMAAVLSLFPNTEDLSVTVDSLKTQEKVCSAKYFFRKISDSVHVLPSLRNLDVEFETFYWNTPRIYEVEMQSIVNSKTACPLLETIVDPERRVWTFQPDLQVLAGFVTRLVGPLMENNLRRLKDLPNPE